MSSCCANDEAPKNGQSRKFKFDLIFHGSLTIIFISLAAYASNLPFGFVNQFGHSVLELFSTMWWGILAGLIFVGLMSKIPRSYFTAVIGAGDSAGSIVKAAIAGVLLDLCNHGILMVGAKLYERGTSLAQVMAFLIASPWNSMSLTFILIALIGLQWTLIFIAGSAVIAILTGLIYQALIKAGYLPENPNKTDIDPNFDLKADAKARLKDFRPNLTFFKEVIHGGMHEAKMIIKWLLVGVIVASALRTFMEPEMFAQYFGPTMVGLLFTLAATTLIEVCSEGSSPIAAELVNGAGAPGNGFTFLMAGVSTDYTEIMVVKEFTGKWMIALSLPLITVPQIVLLGWIMNMASLG